MSTPAVTPDAPQPIADASSIGGPQQAPSPTPQPPAPVADASSIGGAQQAPQAAAPANDPNVRNASDPDEKPQGGTPQSFGHRVLSAVLTGLGGNNQVTYTVDPKTKQLIATQPTTGPGSQFKKIIAAAITGAAAGAGQRGPGAAGRAFQLGENVVQQRSDDQQAQAKQEAYKAYDDQQKALLQKAQMAHLTVQTTAQSLENARLQRQSVWDSQAHADNAVKDWVANGGIDAGTAPNQAELLKLHADNPALIKAAAAGRLMHVEQVNDDGTSNGSKFVYFGEDPSTKPLDHDISIPVTSIDPKTGELKRETQTITAGTMNLGRAMAMQSAAVDQSQKLIGEQAKNKLVQAQTREANATADLHEGENAKDITVERIRAGAEVQKAMVGAGMMQQPGDDTPVESQAQALAHARTAPSLLNRRSKTYDQVMARADAIHMQEFGTHLDQDDIEAKYQAKKSVIKDFADGKPAAVVSSFNNMLGHAQMASSLIQQLRQTNSPLLNLPLNEWKVQTGSPEAVLLSNLKQEMALAIGEYDNIKLNGYAPHSEDKEFEANLQNTNAAPSVMQGVLKTAAGTSLVQLGSLNGRYKSAVGVEAPNILSTTGAQALQHFGLDPRKIYQSTATQAYTPGGTQPQQQPQQQGTPAPAPAGPTGFKWGDHPVAK